MLSSITMTTNAEREHLIIEVWEDRNSLTPLIQNDYVWAIRSVMNDLDTGQLRVAEKINGLWQTHEWVKKAVLLSFRLSTMEIMESPVFGFDKVPSKFANWDSHNFEQAGIRVVPGAVARHSAFIARDVVLMPSFINVGSYIGESTMIDIGSTVGSCAQIGDHCHIAAGVIIGGVLEPIQANPVIIEDHCFIGTQSAVVEGVIIEQGAVIGMGVMLGASTPIVDRASGHIYYGRVPAYSVVIPGVLPMKEQNSIQTTCAVIVKTVNEQTRNKTAINTLLRLDP